MAYATTVSRKRLGSRLRRARASADLTAAQVADVLDVSHSTVIRMEKGQVGVRPDQLDTLVGLYEIEAQREELLELARRQERGWWARYASVLRDGHYAYLSYEAEASEVSTWEPMLVPGFLQTEAYYAAMIAGDTRAARLLEVRLERQRHLERISPAIEVILGEPALYWVMGDHEVMYEQHRRLIEAADRMTIRVVPYERGTDVAGFGGITILRYSDGLEVVWGDTVTGDVSLEDERREVCVTAFDRLRGAALDREASLEMLYDAKGVPYAQ